MQVSFQASDRLAHAIIFGGVFQNTHFDGNELGETLPETWADVTTYHGSPAESDEEILVGYVVYNDSVEEPVAFHWEAAGAARHAEAIADTVVSYDEREDDDEVREATLKTLSIGSVYLSREMFEAEVACHA